MSNTDILDGKWKQLKGKVQQKWGKLTDDDFERIDGSTTELEGLLQERYGMAREEAKKQLKELAGEV